MKLKDLCIKENKQNLIDKWDSEKKLPLTPETISHSSSIRYGGNAKKVTRGRILCSLTWYEYITGNDARENPYQNERISAEDMELLKEAAHWACSQPDYNP